MGLCVAATLAMPMGHADWAMGLQVQHLRLDSERKIELEHEWQMEHKKVVDSMHKLRQAEADNQATV